MSERTSNELPRRTFLKIGAVGAAAAAVGAGRSIVVPKLRQKGLTSSDGLFEATSMAVAESLYEEVYPTSPLILNPFSDELPIPAPARAGRVVPAQTTQIGFARSGRGLIE